MCLFIKINRYYVTTRTYTHILTTYTHKKHWHGHQYILDGIMTSMSTWHVNKRYTEEKKSDSILYLTSWKWAFLITHKVNNTKIIMYVSMMIHLPIFMRILWLYIVSEMVIYMFIYHTLKWIMLSLCFW